ncbi:Do family serine endopeptidase [Patescibacteria group bacterium]|nr:Do family serine endopeptidase [Patescibacteria group bacterium]
MRKKLRLFLFISLAIGIGILVVGLSGVSHNSFLWAEKILELEGPLFQESLKSHPVNPESLEGKVINTAQLISPAVVSVSTERVVGVSGYGEDRFFPPPSDEFEEFFRRFFEQFPQREFRQKGLGSGMIINKNGYILTNEHVIHGVDEDKIMVTLSTNETFKAEIIGMDEDSDIAVLRIEGDDLPVVTLGDSDNLKVGQWVIALGNPFGFALSQLNKKYDPTVTLGVVSAAGRTIRAGREGKIYANLIQTDASINPGNSGGPLVNIYGEVIGINSAILTPSGGSVGIGFAIPINKAKKLLQSLVKYGEIKLPWIGIYMQELTPELAEKFGVSKGVLVADVVKGSPAEKAGVQAGDVVQKVNDYPVENSFDLKEKILKIEIGQKVILTVIRNSKPLEISLVTTPKPKEITRIVKPEKVEEELLGIEVHDITPELREEYNLPEEEKGVVISKVETGSPAHEVGLSSGDIIKMVNNTNISNLSDFKKAVEKVKPGDIVLLRVRHGKVTMFVTIETRK